MSSRWAKSCATTTRSASCVKPDSCYWPYSFTLLSLLLCSQRLMWHAIVINCAAMYCQCAYHCFSPYLRAFRLGWPFTWPSLKLLRYGICWVPPPLRCPSGMLRKLVHSHSPHDARQDRCWRSRPFAMTALIVFPPSYRAAEYLFFTFTDTFRLQNNQMCLRRLPFYSMNVRLLLTESIF